MIYAKEASNKARSYRPLVHMTEDPELLFSYSYYEHFVSFAIADAATNGHFSTFIEIGTDNRSEIIDHLTDFLFFYGYRSKVVEINNTVFLTVNWGHII